MARRGKSQARRQGSSSGTPVWAWLLVGLFVGALGYFGYQQYLAFKKPADDALPIPQSNSNKDASNKNATSPDTDDEDGVLDTDYSFYDVLPSQDTSAVDSMNEPAEQSPDKSLPAKTPTEAELAAIKNVEKPPSEIIKKPIEIELANAKKPEKVIAEPAKVIVPEQSRYMLQAGAFERSVDADDLKARIAMSGQQAQVEQVEINGKTQYRVRLGPFDNTDEANAAKASLSSQGISADKISIK
jgi:cell division protein FtsN